MGINQSHHITRNTRCDELDLPSSVHTHPSYRVTLQKTLPQASIMPLKAPLSLPSLNLVCMMVQEFRRLSFSKQWIKVIKHNCNREGGEFNFSCSKNVPWGQLYWSTCTETLPPNTSTWFMTRRRPVIPSTLSAWT